jgi:hypothetical protein
MISTSIQGIGNLFEFASIIKIAIKAGEQRKIDRRNCVGNECSNEFGEQELSQEGG